MYYKAGNLPRKLICVISFRYLSENSTEEHPETTVVCSLVFPLLFTTWSLYAHLSSYLLLHNLQV
jgi:accessory gene regulator protein AgrB